MSAIPARGLPTTRSAAMGYEELVAKYTLNPAAVEHARTLIGSRRYVLGSDWGDVQPRRMRRTRTSSGTPGRSTPRGVSA